MRAMIDKWVHRASNCQKEAMIDKWVHRASNCQKEALTFRRKAEELEIQAQVLFQCAGDAEDEMKRLESLK